MKHVWTVFCQGSAIDTDTNLLSLFDCIDEMQLTLNKIHKEQNERIIIPGNFQMISLWLREGNEKNGDKLDFKIEFVDPHNKRLIDFKNSIKITDKSTRMRNRSKFNGLPVTTSGRYYFNILKKIGKTYKTQSTIPIDIKIEFK